MAEDYWISFRINYDNEASYNRRYEAFTKAVTDNCEPCWAETSSFYLARSNLDVDALGRRLASKLDRTQDILVMRILAKNASRYFGAIEHLDTLQIFLPDIKKL